MASVPKPTTLSINTNDLMNYKGQLYTITNVGAAVDDGKGNISYACTLNDANTTIVTVSAKDCVLENPGTEAGTGVQVWKQSVKA